MIRICEEVSGKRPPFFRQSIALYREIWYKYIRIGKSQMAKEVSVIPVRADTSLVIWREK